MKRKSQKIKAFFFFITGSIFSVIIFQIFLLNGKISPEQLNSVINSDPLKGLTTIIAALPGETEAEQKVAEALTVRLSDDIDMRGATKIDKLSPKVAKGHLRPSVQVVVYPWLAATASVVPIFKTQGHIYIALEHNRRRNPNKNILNVVQGYMLPDERPARYSSMTSIQHELMDNAEDELYQLKDQGQLDNLSEARKAMAKAYKRQVTLSMNPEKDGEMVEGMQDFSLYDTAIRELHEEVGIKIERKNIRFVRINLGTEARLPVLKGEFYSYNEVENLPQLRPNGFEVDKAFFIDLQKITPKIVNQKVTYSYTTEGITYEIPPKHCKIIARSLIKYRNKSIRVASGKRYDSLENLLQHHQDYIASFSDKERQALKPSSSNYTENNLLEKGVRVITKDLILHASLHPQAQSQHEMFRKLAKVYASKAGKPSFQDIHNNLSSSKFFIDFFNKNFSS